MFLIQIDAVLFINESWKKKMCEGFHKKYKAAQLFSVLIVIRKASSYQNDFFVVFTCLKQTKYSDISMCIFLFLVFYDACICVVCPKE